MSVDDNDLRRLRTQEQFEAARYQALVERVGDRAMYMLDPNGVVLTWNSAAARLEGYKAEEIVGRNFECFFTPEDRTIEKPKELLEAALRDGLCEVEQVRVRKDGSHFSAHVVLHALWDKEGRPIGFAKTTYDVTELVRISHELERTRAALARAQKMEAVGQFAAGMAHDFGNVLMAIQVNLESLKGRTISPSDEAALHRAIGEVERGSQAVRSLMNFARHGSLEMRAINTKVELDKIGGLLRQAIGMRSILELSIASDLWPVQVNANQLELALLNLAVNARDAMPEGGRFRVVATNVWLAGSPDGLTGEFVAISAADTGTGMSPEIAAKAREPFFTTKEEGKGTGLGLGQVFGFAKNYRGTATLETAVGKGTTVTIYIPRHLSSDSIA